MGVQEFIEFTLFVSSELLCSFMQLFEECMSCGQFFVAESHSFQQDVLQNTLKEHKQYADFATHEFDFTVIQAVA